MYVGTLGCLWEHLKSWVNTYVCGDTWMSVGILGCLWEYLAVCGNTWMSVGTIACLLGLLDVCGNTRELVTVSGNHIAWRIPIVSVNTWMSVENS